MEDRLAINVMACKNCGERKGLIQAEYNVYHVRCMNCGAETKRYMTQILAIQKWNLGEVKIPEPVAPPSIQPLPIEQEQDDRKIIDLTLCQMYEQLGIDVPGNHGDVVDFVYDDVINTRDLTEEYTDEDVRIGFRRFIESVSEE
jgi:hypothetical protein